MQQDVPQLVVADFGIASRVQNVATQFTGQRGTPGYEAPVGVIFISSSSHYS